jgi:hypothetical protein
LKKRGGTDKLYAITPTPNTSWFFPYPVLRKTSGAAYPGVPATSVCVLGSSSEAVSRICGRAERREFVAMDRRGKRAMERGRIVERRRNVQVFGQSVNDQNGSGRERESKADKRMGKERRKGSRRDERDPPLRSQNQ